MALTKALRSRFTLAYGKRSFLSDALRPGCLVLTDRRHLLGHFSGQFLGHVHLILPFDTGCCFWGIFGLNREKAKVQKSL